MKPEIIVTVGPASESTPVLGAMLGAGADAFRVNLAHADPLWLSDFFTRLRGIRKDGASVPVIADLPGRKLRTGDLLMELDLLPGERVRLGTQPGATMWDKVIPWEPPDPSPALGPGRVLSLRDGRIILEVEEVPEPPRKGYVCRVIKGGRAVNRMGISFEGASAALFGLLPDRLRIAVGEGVTRLLLSFCEGPEDISGTISACQRLGVSRVEPIPKIETAEALRNLDLFLPSVQTVCVARGDLGTHLPPHELGKAEMAVLEKARKAGRRVLVAGEVLMGCLHLGRPSRAEAVAVRYALENGAAGFILSDETAVGPDPAQAVKAMCALVKG